MEIVPVKNAVKVAARNTVALEEDSVKIPV